MRSPTSATLRAAAGFVAALSLAACTTITVTPARRSAVPSSTTPTVRPTAYVVRHTVYDLAQAIPPRYGSSKLKASTAALYAGWSPRNDPLKGQTVTPAACRHLLRTGGQNINTYNIFPPETTGAVASAGSSGTHRPEVLLVSLQGELGEKFLAVLPMSSPRCRNITIGSGPRRETASIVEKPLPGFGLQARYVVRTFPLAGHRHTERILIFRTPVYVADIRFYGPVGDEEQFFAFARQVRDRADQKLK